MQTITLDESSAALRRILFVAELPAARNEVQRINLGDVGTGDTFTLTYSGQTTSAISWTATDATTASTIDTALEALSNIDASAITVAHVSAQIYAVTFGGNLAATDVALMTITPTGFTPTGITEYQHGGVAGAPALHLTFAAADISISRNGTAPANSAGTVTEIGNGRYYYEATAGEVATQGFLSLAVVREDIAVTFPTVHVAPSSSSLGAPVIRSATAQAGAAGTITLDTGASGTSNYYVPSLIYLRTNAGAGQARLCYAYDGTSKVASIEPEWIQAPDNTTVFDILPVEPLMADLLRVHHATTDTFGDVATPGDIGDEIVPRIIADETAFDGADIALIDGKLPALVSGRMPSDVLAISGSTTAADTLEAHAASVLRVVIDTGSTTTAIILDAATGINGGAPSASNDIFNGRVLVITSGAAVGQLASISGYVGASRTLTVTALTTAPGNDDTAVIV